MILIFFSCTLVKSGLNDFTDLLFVDEWLIERKIDLSNNEVHCRASIPSNANWFGARVRLGSDNKLVKPLWISIEEDQFFDSKLNKVKKLLKECRSGFLFIPEDIKTR